MKKFSVLIALALLAVAGTGYAATCAQDNVPAATLLVPFWKVSRNGATGATISDGGTNTFVAITNVSATGIIVHATLWNRYSKAILDWNIPMTAFDVVTFSMRDVLNGNLRPNTFPFGTTDPCLATILGLGNFGATRYVRFTNPDTSDRSVSISFYANPAYSGTFKRNVWDSVDENPAGDYRSTTSAADYVDNDNPGCGEPSDGTFEGDFSGYLTLDVVNYCTNWFPDQAQFYVNDAIATAGWNVINPAAIYTPNTIFGDIFYVDPAADGSGNISGDQTVPLEFDGGATFLQWNALGVAPRTFYGRYASLVPFDNGAAIAGVPPQFAYAGDGREPLAERFGFRYMNGGGLRSWATIYREDRYDDGTGVASEVNLCNWAYGSSFGFEDVPHRSIITTFNNDEQTRQQSGGPSGDTPSVAGTIFLETQRIDLLNNTDFIPDSGFTGGWINILLPGFNNPAATPYTNQNQAWVGIQHSGVGASLSVGHTATILNNNYLCFAFNAIAPNGTPSPTGNSNPHME